MSEVVNIATLYAKPTLSVSRNEPGADIPFGAHLFKGEADSWSLRRLQTPADGQEPLGYALQNACRAVQAADIYLPSPTAFNGEVIDPADVRLMIPLGKGLIRAYRNTNTPADVTWLNKRGDAYGFSGAGCALFVIEGAGTLFAGHAGRDSILDRERVISLGKRRGRPHEGVVDAVAAKLNPWQMKKVRAWIFWSIPPTAFPHEHNHEVYGEYNRALPEYMRVAQLDPHGVRVFQGTSYLDIPRIFSAQCIKHGILPDNIHLENAYLPICMPHTRNSKNGRYLAMIVRY